MENSGAHDSYDSDLGSGDPEMGKELTKFFLSLLADGKRLQRYYARSTREELISEQELSPEAVRLLREGTLREIEEHILAVQGSHAKPLVIVWPAM